MGFDRARELWQMRRSLYASLPRAEVPEGVALRTFRPGDEDAVLAVNAAAFAEHPEQGRWTRADVDARIAEDWFDPAGLFLAERADGGPDDGELLAFHWTKVHGATHHRHGDGAPHGHDPIGEVYVVGVSPAAQGRGLGRLVTLVGPAPPARARPHPGHALRRRGQRGRRQDVHRARVRPLGRRRPVPPPGLSRPVGTV